MMASSNTDIKIHSGKIIRVGFFIEKRPKHPSELV